MINNTFDIFLKILPPPPSLHRNKYLDPPLRDIKMKNGQPR